MMTTAAAILCVVLCVANVCQGHSAQDEERLYLHLMDKGLHSAVRPVKDVDKAVKVSIGVALLHVESVIDKRQHVSAIINRGSLPIVRDETARTLHLNIWMRFMWKDEYMTWDPADFNGTEVMRFPADRLWYPDIQLYNRREKTIWSEANVVVSSDGTVLHIPPASITTHCDLDFTNFPFDTQTCTLKYGSWTYDGNKVDIDFYDELKAIDTTDYFPNEEWELVGTSGKKTTKYYPCCVEPYPDIGFNLTLARKASYYTYVYLGPAVVLSLLAPFIFLLPPGDQQKMTLGIGLLVCFTLFFLEMSLALPTAHAHTPLIDKYYMTIYVLLCVAMAISTLISNLARRTISFKNPPEFIKKVMLSCLGRCLCVSYTMFADLPSGGEDSLEVKIDGGQGQSQMQRLISTESQVKEWLLIATVLDRLFFLLYVALTILLTIIILASRG